MPRPDGTASRSRQRQETGQRLTVTSSDGTLLACWRHGEGPPLVIVHGTSASHAAWSRVAGFLAPHLTVYTFDRRGRGASGDGPVYALQREVEDVLAVLAATGEPAHLLGHSFGGMVALDTALAAPELASLLLYEPITAAPAAPTAFAERLEHLVAAGASEAALASFLRERTGMSAHDVDLARSSALWPTRVAAAPTIARELRAQAAHEPDWDGYAALRVPTTVLVGGHSGGYADNARALAEAIPNAAVSVLDGQGHAAHLTAPRRLAGALLAALGLESPRPGP